MPRSISADIATRHELARFIDHTALKPEITAAAVETLCAEALEHGFFAVCVNGAHVARVAASLRGSEVKVAAVAGFPLGAMASAAKAFEAERAAGDGASEIDMVMRIDLAKSGDYAALSEDVRTVVTAVAGAAAVKVILETGLLTLDEIAASARAASDAGAHFVKTCTGFSTGAATPEHVALMRKSIDASVQVKASGGIRSLEQAKALIAAGATRLGTSSGVALVTGAASGKSGY